MRPNFLFSLQWHLGYFTKEYTPLYRGFDSFFGFLGAKEDYWDHSSFEDYWGYDLRDNEKVGKGKVYDLNRNKKKSNEK